MKKSLDTMVALLSELDMPLAPLLSTERRFGGIDFFSYSEAPRPHEAPHPRQEVKGFNSGELYYEVKDLAKDVYVEANENLSTRRRRRTARKAKSHEQRPRPQPRPQSQPRPQPQAIDEDGDGDNIEEMFQDSASVSQLKYASISQEDPTPWQDIMLYALSGILLLILLEQVFRLGMHVANMKMARIRGNN